MKPLDGLKILVVDDENDIREIVVDEFIYSGAEVFNAPNGKIAFELYQAHGPFDIVLSDVRMPGGDGIELLRNIMSQKGPKPLVHLISGFTDVTVPEALKLGAKSLISKPFHIDHVIQLLSKK